MAEKRNKKQEQNLGQMVTMQAQQAFDQGNDTFMKKPSEKDIENSIEQQFGEAPVFEKQVSYHKKKYIPVAFVI